MKWYMKLHFLVLNWQLGLHPHLGRGGVGCKKPELLQNNTWQGMIAVQEKGILLQWIKCVNCLIQFFLRSFLLSCDLSSFTSGYNCIVTIEYIEYCYDWIPFTGFRDSILLKFCIVWPKLWNVDLWKSPAGGQMPGMMFRYPRCCGSGLSTEGFRQIHNLCQWNKKIQRSWNTIGM